MNLVIKDHAFFYMMMTLLGLGIISVTIGNVV